MPVPFASLFETSTGFLGLCLVRLPDFSPTCKVLEVVKLFAPVDSSVNTST